MLRRALEDGARCERERTKMQQKSDGDGIRVDELIVSKQLTVIEGAEEACFLYLLLTSASIVVCAA